MDRFGGMCRSGDSFKKALASTPHLMIVRAPLKRAGGVKLRLYHVSSILVITEAPSRSEISYSDIGISVFFFLFGFLPL